MYCISYNLTICTNIINVSSSITGRRKRVGDPVTQVQGEDELKIKTVLSMDEKWLFVQK